MQAIHYAEWVEHTRDEQTGETLTHGLFDSYINRYLKLKLVSLSLLVEVSHVECSQEASGWPAECVSREERRAYIARVMEREGVQIDEANVEKNPGLRQVSKLLLNSLVSYLNT